MKKLFVLITVLLTTLFLARVSLAATYYVATNGNDANPGTLDRPFATINTGIGKLSAGDTLYLRGGTYVQTVSVGKSGTASTPITISGYPGETAVIDGQDTLPAGDWGILFGVSGNYVTVRDLKIQQSQWFGLHLSGHHDQAINVKVHRCKDMGIYVGGDYSLVENCESYYNARWNEFGQNLKGSWASGISACRHPKYVTLRGNKVWNNWGEGLSTYESEYTTLEDNIVYDSWSTNVYLSDTKYSILRRNLVYCTPESPMKGTGGSGVGIMMGDETYNPASSDNIVVNNLVMGCRRNFYWWQGVQGGGLVNVLIAYNTFVDSSYETDFIIGYGGPHSNTRIENNIIFQEDSLPVAIIASSSGLAFSSNLWSKTPPSSASGTGDVIGDPKLAKTGQTGAGQLTAEWFKILSASPAINKAKVLTEVSEDFFKTSRGSSPDIGAYEYVSSSLTGDVNNDGSVNILDVQACVNHILGIQNYGTRADVNGDGSVNVLDVQAVVNIILGV